MTGSNATRWVLAGGFAVAIAYAIVAIVEVLVNTRPATAIPFACTAVTIAGPLAIAVRLLDLGGAQGPGAEGSTDGNGSGPPGGGGDGPTPPWWPDFEREFWAHVDTRVPRERETATPV